MLVVRLSAPGGFPLIIEWSDAAKEYAISGEKADGQPSNVGIYLKQRAGGVVYNRGEIDPALQGNPFNLDGDNRITNIGTP